MNPNTALLVIDVQMDFVLRQAEGRAWANPEAGARIAELLAGFRAAGRPVVHVHHRDPEPGMGFHPSDPGFAVQPCAAPLPGEPVHVKQHSPAFIGTGLEADLRAAGITALVVAGGAANYCVDSTVRMSGALGFDTTVVTDALIGFGQRARDGRRFSAEDVLAMTLADLDGEFARLTDTASVLADLT